MPKDKKYNLRSLKRGEKNKLKKNSDSDSGSDNDSEYDDEVVIGKNELNSIINAMFPSKEKKEKKIEKQSNSKCKAKKNKDTDTMDAWAKWVQRSLNHNFFKVKLFEFNYTVLRKYRRLGLFIE